MTGDAATLAAAVEAANLPTLALIVFQLTDDPRWLEEPFRATRAPGLDDHDTGGYAEAVQAEIKAAAREALAAGAPVPPPRRAQLKRMLESLLGEEVSHAYEEMAATELGLSDRVGDAARALPADLAAGASAIIVGAGVSGLAAARELRELGLHVTVLEQNEEVGGTWLDNAYPGVGVDTPSQLYSFSFFPRAWSRHFAHGPEVREYLRDFCDHFALRDHIRFGHEVLRADYREAGQRWSVLARDRDGREVDLEADFLLTGVGQLNRPKVPQLPGADTFAGEAFHSARWPADLDIRGRRVAVIGSGASAMQIVPAIAGDAAHVSVLQRSPAWIAPHENYRRPVSAEQRWLLAEVPFYRQWSRIRMAWLFNDKAYPSLQVDRDWEHQDRSVSRANDRTRQMMLRYMAAQLDGREDLLAACTPSYPPYGKRTLLDNGWYAALQRPDVTLETAGIECLTADGVRTTDGREHHADVIVYATGFQALQLLAPMQITGRDGRTIRDAWGDDDPSAYLGITTPGFPNLFFLYGPNTNLGHGGSYMSIAEAQLRYITEAVALALGSGAGAIECREEVAADFRRDVDATHAERIWMHPSIESSWYRNSRGRVVANWPWSFIEYWQRTRSADESDFHLEPRRERAHATR